MNSYGTRVQEIRDYAAENAVDLGGIHAIEVDTWLRAAAARLGLDAGLVLAVYVPFTDLVSLRS